VSVASTECEAPIVYSKDIFLNTNYTKIERIFYKRGR
jgi:hypothetical protein